MPSTASNAIRIEVSSQYMPEQSDPGEQRFAFRYHITIHNEGQQSAQLLTRHWIITDGNGETKELQGQGVVGEQPEIEPGDSFEYSSGCVLNTEVGCMRGHYEMESSEGQRFKTPIPLFSLAVPHALH